MPGFLLIGASGQVGAALVRRLGAQALVVPRTDFDLAASTATQAAALVASLQPEAVLCVAGATDVERCEREPAWAEAVNTRGPLQLADAAAEVPFVYLSTDYVFEGESGPYSEDDAVHPLSVYGQSKLDAERALLERFPRALVVRTTGVFGPDAQEKNFAYTLRRVLRSGGEMRVPFDQFSNPAFNEDLAAAIVALLERRACGLFHAAGPEFLSRYDFALRVAGILQLDASRIRPVATSGLGQKAARPLRSGLRTGKLDAAVGASCFRPLDDAIRAFAAHLNRQSSAPQQRAQQP